MGDLRGQHTDVRHATLSRVLPRAGAVSSWAQRVLMMVDATMRELKWEPAGLDPPWEEDTVWKHGMSHVQTAE